MQGYFSYKTDGLHVLHELMSKDRFWGGQSGLDGNHDHPLQSHLEYVGSSLWKIRGFNDRARLRGHEGFHDLNRSTSISGIDRLSKH